MKFNLMLHMNSIGFDNMGNFWIRHYESDTFKEEIDAIWEQVQDLYVDLHAYVRHRLSQTYSQFSEEDTIPAHILGKSS